MSHGPDLNPVINSFPRCLPKGLVCWSFIAFSAGVFGAHWSFAQFQERAMASFLMNTVYFLGMCQGAAMFAVALTLTKGRWGRGLKRIAESFAIFLPVLYIGLLSFLLLGGLEIFPWMHEDLPAHKAIYLRKDFFLFRQVAGIGLLIWLTYRYIRASWRPDLGMMQQRLGDSAPAWWGWFTKDFGDLPDEIEASEKSQRFWGAILAIAYSLVFSLVAVDLEMSLSPHWFANMFPAWFFMSSMWLGMVAIGIYSTLASKWLSIDHLLTPSVYHDLGKLIFAFCMFWGYTTFAQFLAIWYGNMTEEIGFILIRTQLAPWATLSKVVVLCCFLIPWTLLLSRGMKKIRSGFLAGTSLIAVGLFLERFLVTMPSVWTESTLPLGFGEILMPFGFAGAMVLMVSAILTQIPSAPLTDSMYAPNPLDVHVHPSRHHAA